MTDVESRSIGEVEPGGTGTLGKIDEVMSKASLGHLDALMKSDGALIQNRERMRGAP
jgi:hypothetical protein